LRIVPAAGEEARVLTEIQLAAIGAHKRWHLSITERRISSFLKKRSERGFASQVNVDGGGEGEPDSNLHAKKKTKDHVVSFL
jgi:hypothetical protein